MIKKIAITSMLISSLAYAEVKQKGFFAGLDYAMKSVDLKYENTGLAFPFSSYTAATTDKKVSLKVGYQYYFTRIYARVENFHYHDSEKNRYSIKGRTYEANVEYLPVLYMEKSKKWDIRGIVGIGIGYQKNTLYDYNAQLLPSEPLNGESQTHIEYGAQFGVVVETDFGINMECGLRARKGDLLEFTDTTNNATFLYYAKEYYLGVNYLF